MAYEYEEIAKAKGSKIDDELMELAHSSFAEVRAAVARNIHAPLAALELLSGDRRKDISTITKARLNAEDSTASQYVDEYVEVINFDEEVTMHFSTLQNEPGINIIKSLGLVYGTSSKVALGLNTQATRINSAMHIALLDAQFEAKKLGANAVVGLLVSTNSSQGASSAFLGSSEGVLVVGTAVIVA